MSGNTALFKSQNDTPTQIQLSSTSRQGNNKYSVAADSAIKLFQAHYNQAHYGKKPDQAVDRQDMMLAAHHLPGTDQHKSPRSAPIFNSADEESMYRLRKQYSDYKVEGVSASSANQAQGTTIKPNIFDMTHRYWVI